MLGQRGRSLRSLDGSIVTHGEIDTETGISGEPRKAMSSCALWNTPRLIRRFISRTMPE